MHVYCRCSGCGTEKWVSYYNLKGGRTKGCRQCNQPWRFRRPDDVPTWLYERCKGMHDRCTNPNHSAFEHYGARGVEFRFTSPAEAARWIRDNLGIPSMPKTVEIDRVDNDGHYAPGNIRWANRAVQLANRRRAITPAVHRFRQEHPDVRYADSTLKRLLGDGMTFEEIRHRFYHLPSTKPKGKYGTFSTPDPVIASLHTDS